MTDQFFPYQLDRRWTGLFVALGVGRNDGVTVGDDGSLMATYGWFRVETTIDNVDRTAVTGPHRWYTAVGLRLSLADDGLTFGTNNQLGLCIEFVEPVRKVIGLRDHSALWLSVADPAGLAVAIG